MNDDLNAARGILSALSLSLLAWGLLGLALWVTT